MKEESQRLVEAVAQDIHEKGESLEQVGSILLCVAMMCFMRKRATDNRSNQEQFRRLAERYARIAEAEELKLFFEPEVHPAPKGLQ